MTLKELLMITWYIQDIQIVSVKNQRNELFHGTNHELRSDNYKALLNRTIANVGAINNTLIIELF